MVRKLLILASLFVAVAWAAPSYGQIQIPRINASSFGRTLMSSVDAPAGRNALGASGGVWPVSVGGTGAATLTGLIKGNGTSAFTAAVAGTDYQGVDAELTSLAGLTSAADKVPYYTGSGTAALADFPSALRTFLSSPSSANFSGFLNDETGTNGGFVRATSPSIASPTITGTGTFDGSAITLGSFPAITPAPLNVTVNGSGIGFIVANSATEYTDFISGGALKGLRGHGAVKFVVQNDGDLALRSGGSVDHWLVSSGHFLAGTDNTYDIGASGATRPRDLFLGDDLSVGDDSTFGGQVNLASSLLTISSDAVTATKGHHTVDTEAAAASDDLATISGGAEGDVLILRAANDAHTVVIKDGTGNIQSSGDFSLDNAQDVIIFIFDGTSWLVVSEQDNGS